MEFLHAQKPLPLECSHSINPFVSIISMIMLNVCSLLSLDVLL